MGVQPVAPGKDRALGAYRKRCGELNKAFLASGDGGALIRGRARAVDELVLALYRRVFSPALDQPAGFCLVAIGGYGREELFPHSDVDLLLLFERQVGQGVGREAMAEFLRELWDAGLRLGHTTRLLSECGRFDAGNTEFGIAALDARFLAGDRALFSRLAQEAIPSMVRREQDALVKNLTALAELRHRKYGGTIYHLEPDLKDSPGGLRDYQLAGWLARILRADEKGVPGRADLPETARQEAAEAFAFLAASRCHLHLLAGRDSNTLTFDMQAQIAARFKACGAGGPPAPRDESDTGNKSRGDPRHAGASAGAASPEQWMRQYFRHARVTARLATHAERQAAAPRPGLSQWFKQRQERFSNADFVVHGGEIFLRNPSSAQRDPAVWLDLFDFQARHGLVLSLETERRIERQIPEIAQWASAASGLWPRFRRILAQPQAWSALSTMHELGLLGALFPEFRLIESLVIRDLYHKYTVDQHSLIAIQHVQELKGEAAETPRQAAPAAAEKTPSRFFADLYAELDEPELLLVALLFHDLGKSAPANHVAVSVELVRQILDRLDLDPDERHTVLLLVEIHLKMSEAISSRDIGEGRVVREFAECVGTVETLKMLCLLTWADIKSVNPTALTPWKEEALWQLYLAAHAELTRQLDTDRTTPGEAASRGVGSLPRPACPGLPWAGVPARASGSEPAAGRPEPEPAQTPGPAPVFRPEVAAFLDGLPRRYLRTHSPGAILAHARMARDLAADPVALTLTRKQTSWELLVVTADHPFLFAAITGTLAAMGMNILKAEAFSNRHGTIIDTFRFADLHRTLELNPEESDRLLAAVRDAILGHADVGRMLEGRLDAPPLGRSTYQLETTLRFDNSASASSTLLEVVTRDRLGLLYRISNVLSAHGCNIEVVLVDTQGHKAIDVFYLTRQGAQLDAEWQAAIAKELRRVLE